MNNEDLFISKGDGIKLRVVRNNMGLSVAEFSEKTEINTSFINLLEKGCLPLSARNKRKIGEAFRLPENWFETIDTSHYLQLTASNPEEENIEKNKCEDVLKIPAEKQEPKQIIIINNGETLKLTRIAVGLSRKELAEAIGITSVQIGYIETGKRSLTEKVKNKLNNYFKTVSIPQNILMKNMEILNKVFREVDKDTETSSYNISNDEILNKIRLIKKEKGYTQTVVSEKTGINRSQLSMIENSRIQISKNVKVKLLNFIQSETESIKCVPENPLSENTPAPSTTFDSVNFEQEKNSEIITDNILPNKCELIKVIEKMKKTRDEMIENINMLEIVLNSCK